MPRLHLCVAALSSSIALVPFAPPLAAQARGAEEQIAAAVLAAPQDRRAGAAVLGYNAAGQLVKLREGSNEILCLADDPAVDGFEVNCYHVSLEPYMARGRELAGQGVAGQDRYRIRWQEAEQGELRLPEAPATLYTLSGSSYDAAANTVVDEYRRSTVYIPYATEASTGLSRTGSTTDPWIMFPGTPGAHIMITPPRRPGGG